MYYDGIWYILSDDNEYDILCLVMMMNMEHA